MYIQNKKMTFSLLVVFLLCGCGSGLIGDTAFVQSGGAQSADSLAGNGGLIGAQVANPDVDARDGESVEDFGVYSNTSPLDVLLVIDNSGSMSSVSKKIAERLSPLLQHVSHLQWRIAITTSLQTDCLRAVLDRSNESNVGEIFNTTVNNLINENLNGTDRSTSDDERVLEMATRALQGQLALRTMPHRDGNCNGAKVSWVRENSMLAVLFVSDEDTPSESIQPFYDQIQAIRAPHVSAKVYGIISEYGSSKYRNWKDAEQMPLLDMHMYMHRYEGGQAELQDFDKILGEISKNIYEQTQRTFVLQREPIDLRVVVIHKDGVTRQELTSDQYTIQGRTLTVSEDLSLSDVNNVKAFYK